MAALLGLFLAACVHGPKDVSATMGRADSYWRLESIDGEKAPAQRVPPVILRFGKDGTFHGTAACNSVGGAARWHPDGRFSGLDQPLITTTAGCLDLDAALAFAERFWSNMPSASGWRQERGMIIISLGNGSTAVFRPHPNRFRGTVLGRRRFR
ncbi:META domain-containing protein [Sphingomonas sanxanigenens]|uniref:DUF306 domain-containing protein n=1 Tax=Sphingomonas sanxanigenens DSM 19645 = NX02 TaxID=1123269 RepID=W0ALE3_9SPHN|nr:META domain-containing protein [Sphingomonas sanxanigenens]AHE57123.1 hypothetical protein NX02_27700 [Sphingomonas sanxanigenens DSM 19645 = NX02]